MSLLKPIPLDALDEAMRKLERMLMEAERPLQPPHTFDECLPFNEYDDAIMHDILGKRFGPVVQSLLERLHALDATRGSFGVDATKALEALLPDLRKLREACKSEWIDIR